MENKLLFTFTHEFQKTKRMSGKIWKIRILSGELRIGDKICIYGVKPTNDVSSCFIKAEIKSIFIETGVENQTTSLQLANESDIVTIDLKNCYSDKKKINKNDIFIDKICFGVYCKEEICEYSDILLKLDQSENSDQIISKFHKNESSKKPVKSKVKVIWFGSKLEFTVIKAIDNTIYVSLNHLNVEHSIFLPIDTSLKRYFSKIIIKRKLLIDKEKKTYRYIYSRASLE
jgi:hypothetical protein